MDNPIQSAIAESLPADVNTVPSTADAPEVVTADSPAAAPVETPTPKVEQEEIPFHQHPRWQEVQEARRKAAEEAAQAKAEAAYWKGLAEGRQPNQQPQPEVDPYAGMTLEEKAFWQKQREVAREEAMKVAREYGAPLEKKITESQEVVAALAYERFRNQYPDIQPNSLEETKIADYYRRGYSLDDAYKIVKFDEVKQKSVTQAKTQQVIKTQQKAAANLEQTSLPPVSGLPQKEKVNFRQLMAKNLEAAGY